MTPTGNLTVSATVSNVGMRVGTETVQLYIRDLVGSITRPVNELKAFKQVETWRIEEGRILDQQKRCFVLQLGFKNM